MKLSKVFNWTVTTVVVLSLISLGVWINQWIDQTRVLKNVIERLSSDSRIAEVLVTKSEYDEETKRVKTTIKFLEFDTQGKPIKPKYFTFQGNIIQFQSLVIRFNDRFVQYGDKLKGKSAYLFLKAFVLDGKNTQEFDITRTEDVPGGYKLAGETSEFEKNWWRDFWSYALDPELRNQEGIKSAQIEAPGALFVPGTIYTIRIEHDGGMRIDTQPVPEVLRGEQIA